jgi:polyhydroxyalkanoate synthesis regulator phasin
MANTTVQRIVDAGADFSDMSRKQAESIVKALVKAGEVRRADAEKAVQTIVDRSRETSDRLGDNVQREVSKQMTWLSERFDELEDRFEELAEKIAERVKTEIQSAQNKTPAKKAPAKKKAVAKKAPAKKKAVAKKAPAKKKAAAKKAPAKKKAAAKKAPAKKAAAAASSD